MNESQNSRSQRLVQIGFGLGLFALIVAGRTLPHVMNFAPVAAAGLFAGFLFPSRWMGGAVILAGMLVSDLVIGMDDLGMRLLVYIALVLPVFLGRFLQNFEGGAVRFSGAVLGLGLTGSLVFFLVTNFGVWLGSGLYTLDLSGLVLCYVKAIPFYRGTLMGDVFYLAVFFGLHGLLSIRSPASRSAAA